MSSRLDALSFLAGISSRVQHLVDMKSEDCYVLDGIDMVRLHAIQSELAVMRLSVSQAQVR